MESTHKRELTHRFQPQSRDMQAVELGIPDDYGFMDAELSEQLRRVASLHLP